LAGIAYPQLGAYGREVSFLGELLGDMITYEADSTGQYFCAPQVKLTSFDDGSHAETFYYT
jgi:hypothetical protein